MTPRVLAVIPARLNSTRFPNKVIYPFRGRPLIYYIYREVSRARSVDRVVVATDSHEVKRTVESWGGEALLTSRRHRTGSDRVAEVMRRIGGQIIINVQADNFGLKASVLDRAVRSLAASPEVRFATLARVIRSEEELHNPSIVKVAASRDGNALWFSRLPIPYLQHAGPGKKTARYPFLAHIGVYFFRRRGLADFAKWPQSPLEKAESLEQLRILEHGEKIKVLRTSMRSVSVDTPRDLPRLAALYN